MHFYSLPQLTTCQWRLDVLFAKLLGKFKTNTKHFNIPLKTGGALQGANDQQRGWAELSLVLALFACFIYSSSIKYWSQQIWEMDQMDHWRSRGQARVCGQRRSLHMQMFNLLPSNGGFCREDAKYGWFWLLAAFSIVTSLTWCYNAPGRDPPLTDCYMVFVRGSGARKRGREGAALSRKQDLDCTEHRSLQETLQTSLTCKNGKQLENVYNEKK